MTPHHHEQHQYDDLPVSFRLLQLLPGTKDDHICCSLHVVNWLDPPPDYEALSYVWGNIGFKSSIRCDGKRLDVTENLHAALAQLRHADRTRMLWVDAICTNQLSIPERGCQVAQMRRIYETAQSTIVWLGQDAENPQAKLAAKTIIFLSEMICQRLDTSVSDLPAISDLYNELIFKRRDQLPKPGELGLSSKTWDALKWLYSRPYFTRTWVVQEINSNTQRVVQCGDVVMDWQQLQLVAGYLIVDAAWSKAHGFSEAYCWYASRISAGGFTNAESWLQMLYLASNFRCTDPRDQIFGVRGLIRSKDGVDMLRPDYSKSALEVYRDSVAAALMDFKTTDVLNYTAGTQLGLSWVPEWNRSMLFRNPFRFGKVPPWKPAGDTVATWRINPESNILHLSGYAVGSIELTEPYNEEYFCDSKMQTEQGRVFLDTAWQRILRTVGKKGLTLPLNNSVLTAMAACFSFGLDENADPADENRLLLNFVAYLRAVLDRETFDKFISPETFQQAQTGDGKAFGKPVWDFKYPESTVFVTTSGLIGCSSDINLPGDIVFVPLGSRYLLILRPQEGYHLLRGYAFVHGRMFGETPTQTVEFAIR